MNDMIQVNRQVTTFEPFMLPPDIEGMAKRLSDVIRDVSAFRRQADGLLFFGKIGWDGMLGLVPVVGEAYSLYASTVLIQEAIKAKCSMGTKLAGVTMMGIDFAIGLLPGAGDIADLFFRSHAWFGGMIINDVETKLASIEDLRRRLPTMNRHEQEAAVSDLRDQLFRGGRTHTMQLLRLTLVAAVCMFALQQCRLAHDARQATIQACEARGGWFCSMRN